MNYGVKLKKTDKNYKRFAKQRKERGWDDSETWNLYNVIGKFIVPRLRRFIELNNGHPPLITMDEWTAILKEIADGLDSLETIDNMWLHDNYKNFTPKQMTKEEKKLYKKVDKALKLFRQYFFDLWW